MAPFTQITPSSSVPISGRSWSDVARGGGSVLVLVKVDVAVCDDMPVRLVRIVDVHLRHDGAEDQTWCQRERD